MRELDVSRVLCTLAELDAQGSRGFTIGEGHWPLRGFVVRGSGGVPRAFVNVCPHAGHGLNLLPHRFLTPGGELIICASHGALFERETGLCVAGPCTGRRLRPVPIEVAGDSVLLAPDVDPAALTR